MDRTAWIVVTLCTAGLIAWFYWQPKYQPPPPALEAVNAVPAETASTEVTAQAPASATPETAAIEPVTPEKIFDVTINSVVFQFTTYGGGIKTATLPPHFFSGDEPTILNDQSPAPVGALSSRPGELNDGIYELTSPEGQTPVIFQRKLPTGLVVRKTWTPVTEGAGHGFMWQLNVTFENQGSVAATGQYSLYSGLAAPLLGNELPVSVCWNADGGPESEEVRWFNGSSFLGMQFRAPTSLMEKSFNELLWVGAHSQYYTTLVAHTKHIRELPPGSLWARRIPVRTGVNGDTHNTDGVYVAAGLPDLNLAPGASLAYDLEVYMGPRAQSVLSKLPKERYYGEAMFYGMFGFISKPMLWLLTVFERWMRFSSASWGLAIILLTLVVRGVLWPLNLKATRQMKRMSLLSPKMKELQEKYKDDPMRMNREVMGLYKKYGVNPVSGCFPIFLQIPIFFGLYTMLRHAVELRGHGFWWVNDLALPDTQFYLAGFPINPLPIVMALTMFVQMALTPKSPDPNMKMQQRIFLLMPFFFLFFCYNFAAALALYWTISNIIGIVQSWIIKKMPEPELVEQPEVVSTPKKGGKPSFAQIFAERLAEQQKLAEARARNRKPRSK